MSGVYSAAPEDAVLSAVGLGVTLATAESLTAGMVSAALASVPGASQVLRGGVVSYHREVKEALLGVNSALLSRVGAVDPQVAEQMADGARQALDASIGIATTGVAGPEPHEGRDVGTVVVAVVGAEQRLVREFLFRGNRSQIRQAACEAALSTLNEVLAGMVPGTIEVPQ